MGYQGLRPETFRFLEALDANNTRDWFEAHRSDYERDWLAAGLDLIAALAPFATDMGLMAVPKLNQSLRRIHRDTRFSRDKTPYQPWLHLILSTGPDFSKGPGMHLVFRPGGIAYGAGLYAPAPDRLEQLRQRLCVAHDRAAFLAALAAAAQVGSALDPPELARVPKGFAAEADWDHLLRRKSFIVRTQADLAPPHWLFTPAAPDELARLTRAHLPLLHWLSG